MRRAPLSRWEGMSQGHTAEWRHRALTPGRLATRVPVSSGPCCGHSEPTALGIISCFTQKTLGSGGSRGLARVPQEKWLSWGSDPKLLMLPPMLPATRGLPASNTLISA